MFDLRIFRRNVRYLLGATRGGPMRAKIMALLCENPMNPNQLSEILAVDYKTITHHLGVLRKHHWVISDSEKYGSVFRPAFTDEQYAIFRETIEKFGIFVR